MTVRRYISGLRSAACCHVCGYRRRRRYLRECRSELSEQEQRSLKLKLAMGGSHLLEMSGEVRCLGKSRFLICPGSGQEWGNGSSLVTLVIGQPHLGTIIPFYPQGGCGSASQGAGTRRFVSCVPFAVQSRDIPPTFMNVRRRARLRLVAATSIHEFTYLDFD